MTTIKEKKWNDKVELVIISEIYDNFNPWVEKNITVDSNVINSLHDILNKQFTSVDYNKNSIMCHLFTRFDFFLTAMLKFRKNKNAFINDENKVLYVEKPMKKRGAYLYSIYSKFKHLFQDIELSEKDYNYEISLDDNAIQLAQKFSTDTISIYINFLNKNLCIFSKEKDIILNIKKEIPTEDIFTPVLQPEFLSELCISSENTNIADIFKHYNTTKNLFLLNDGTGSGKTYNTILNFIKYSCDTERKNMVFSAPQKNQLLVSDNIYREAQLKDVLILVYRSNTDLCNLDMNNLSNFLENKTLEKQSEILSYIFNLCDSSSINKKIKSLYKKRVKILHNVTDEDEEGYLEQHKKQIPSLSHVKKDFNKYVNICKDEVKVDYIDLDDYEKDKTQYGSDFTYSIRQLAEFFVVHLEDYEINDIINGTTPRSKSNEFIYLLLCFVLPFEIAKFKNIVILLTTDKSATQIAYSDTVEKNDKKYKKLVTTPIDYLMSGCDDKNIAGIFQYINAPDEKVAQYLKTEFFKHKGNFFTKNDISFSYVIDEEHTAYNKFLEEYSYKDIINKETNLIHALATTHRWINNTKNNKKKLVVVNEHFEKNKIDIINSLRQVLKEKTTLTDDVKIDKFFKFMSDNELGIYIHKKDYDFITSVCQNIISFTSKLIMNKELLKSIKIHTNSGDDVVYLYKDIQHKDENIQEEQYTLLDLLQVILCLFYVSRKMTNRSLNYFSKSLEDNQNRPLYNLMYQSVKHKDYLENMFDSYTDLTEETNINILFTYFLSKIVFSCENKFQEKALIPDSDYMKIKLNIFLIKELPEVNVLRILQNPKNKVFLLSATRGLNNIYSGNYSEDFFNKVNQKYYDNKLIHIEKRELYEHNPMIAFTNDRFNTRASVSVNKISFNKNIAKLDTFIIDKIDDVTHNNAKNDITSLLGQNENHVDDSNLFYNIEDKIKKESWYQQLYAFHKIEAMSVFNSIAHAFYKNKNAMIMTLTNKFYNNVIKNKPNFMATLFGSDYKVSENIIGDKNSCKIFEIKPVRLQHKKIKIICFDSELGKMPNLKDLMKTDNDTILILVSSYQSAGTGLNLTPTEEEDFESIYFISGPYYTSIKNSKTGLFSISNHLIMMKNLAHKENKTVSEFKDGLNNRKLLRVLMDEHLMEQVKTIMQAVGRIERRNCGIDTSIYFVNNSKNSLFEEVMFGYAQIYNRHKNEERSILENFSLLNKSILKTALLYASEHSLSIKDKKMLQNKSKENFKNVSEFFQYTYSQALSKYRQGDPLYEWLKEFNQIIREYNHPQYNIDLLLKKFISKHEDILIQCGMKSKLTSLCHELTLNLPDNWLNAKLGINYEEYYYSDISETGHMITNNVLFSYSEDLIYSHGIKGELVDFYNNYIIPHNDTVNVKLTKLPDIYLKDIIKGNIGEYIFELYLKDYDIQYNQMNLWFNENVAHRTYELFDFYVLKNDTLYCIDVKNWSLNNDAAFKKTESRVDDKIKILMDLNQNKYKLEFLYVNMYPEKNASISDGLNIFLGDRALYINFLSRIPSDSETSKKDTYIISIDLEEKIR